MKGCALSLAGTRTRCDAGKDDGHSPEDEVFRTGLYDGPWRGPNWRLGPGFVPGDLMCDEVLGRNGYPACAELPRRTVRMRPHSDIAAPKVAPTILD
ncbi:hypothetical protein [Rhodovulum sp. YEN HP10]|uniref:hypothetical protein n=1 Tax=Rhodovulum sp. HP10 TaxID=3387397 RepID=UPI0039E0FAE4